MKWCFDYAHIEIRMMRAALDQNSMWDHVYRTPELTIDGEARLADEGRMVLQCGVSEGLPRIPLLSLER